MVLGGISAVFGTGYSPHRSCVRRTVIGAVERSITAPVIVTVSTATINITTRGRYTTRAIIARRPVTGKVVVINTAIFVLSAIGSSGKLRVGTRNAAELVFIASKNPDAVNGDARI